MKQAARIISPTTTDLPASIGGADLAAQTESLLQLQSAVGNELTRHTHEALAAAVHDLVRRLNADQATLQKIMDAMPGTTPEEAVSVALRICAGCTDGAKPVRETVMTDLPGGGRGERKIEPHERAADAQYLLVEAATDRVYAAGVAIGPLDKKERNKQEPIFHGIPVADQDALYPEYFQRYPR